MAKVTIANYLIGNLSNRFPIMHTGLIDHDIIDVMVDNWEHNKYPFLGLRPKEETKKSSQKRLLM